MGGSSGFHGRTSEYYRHVKKQMYGPLENGCVPEELQHIPRAFPEHVCDVRPGVIVVRGSVIDMLRRALSVFAESIPSGLRGRFEDHLFLVSVNRTMINLKFT